MVARRHFKFRQQLRLHFNHTGPYKASVVLIWARYLVQSLYVTMTSMTFDTILDACGLLL